MPRASVPLQSALAVALTCAIVAAIQFVSGGDVATLPSVADAPPALARDFESARLPSPPENRGEQADSAPQAFGEQREVSADDLSEVCATLGAMAESIQDRAAAMRKKFHITDEDPDDASARVSISPAHAREIAAIDIRISECIEKIRILDEEKANTQPYRITGETRDAQTSAVDPGDAIDSQANSLGPVEGQDITDSEAQKQARSQIAHALTQAVQKEIRRDSLASEREELLKDRSMLLYPNMALASYYTLKAEYLAVKSKHESFARCYQTARLTPLPAHRIRDWRIVPR